MNLTNKNEEVYEMGRLEQDLKNAMETGEMKKFLLGEGSYCFSCREDYCVECMRLISIYDYYKTDPNVKPAFEQGLLDLINDSVYDIFEAFKYLKEQASRKSSMGEFKSPFELDKDVYIKLRQAILSKKEELQNIKSVNRDDVPVKSAYQYMESLNDEYKSKYGRGVY